MTEKESDRKSFRSKLLLELVESEARYASALRSFCRIAEQSGWSRWHSKVEREDRKSPNGPFIACLKSVLEQIAILSECTAAALARSMKETGGDRVAKQLWIMTDALGLYEEYALLYGLAQEGIGMLASDEAFVAEWRTAVSIERERLSSAQSNSNKNIRIEISVDEEISIPVTSSVLAAYSKVHLPSTLSGFLIMPIQRLPRYELLLGQIIEQSVLIEKESAKVQPSWFIEETELLRLISDSICTVTKRMDSISHYDGTAPIDTFSKYENRMDICCALNSKSGGMLSGLSLLLESEQSYFSHVSKIVKSIALPVLRISLIPTKIQTIRSGVTDFDDSDSEGEEETISNAARQTLAASSSLLKSDNLTTLSFGDRDNDQKALELWLEKLSSTEQAKLREILWESGLMLFSLELLHCCMLSVHLIRLLEPYDRVWKGNGNQNDASDADGDFIHTIFWISNITRLLRGYEMACARAVHSLCKLCVTDYEALGISLKTTESLEVLFPKLVLPIMLGSQNVLFGRQAKLLRHSLFRRFCRECACIRSDGFGISDMLRMPFERSSHYKPCFELAVKNPEKLRNLRYHFTLCMEQATRSQRFIYAWLNTRVLSMFHLFAEHLVVSRTEGKEESIAHLLERSFLVRVGALYGAKNKVHIVWLFSNMVLHGQVRLGSGPRDNGPVITSFVCVKLSREGTVLTELSSFKLQLPGKIIFKVPENGEPHFWTVPSIDAQNPVTARVDLFGAWVRDINRVHLRIQREAA